MSLVLLVEDSEDDAFFFRRAVRLSGAACEVHHLADGGQAKSFLQAAAEAGTGLPDLMFLDLKMPVMNGFELLEWIDRQGWAAEVPAVVLSGSEHQDDLARARGLGARDYLVKPLRPADIQRVFQNLVEGRFDCQQIGGPV